MRLLQRDPTGIIPQGFGTDEYTVLGFKLLRTSLYVMVKFKDSEDEFQFPYKRIVKDAMRRGIRL